MMRAVAEPRHPLLSVKIQKIIETTHSFICKVTFHTHFLLHHYRVRINESSLYLLHHIDGIDNLLQ